MIIPRESMFDTSILMLQEVDKYVQLCYHVGLLDKKYAFAEEQETIAGDGQTGTEKQSLLASTAFEDPHVFFVKEEIEETNVLGLANKSTDDT